MKRIALLCALSGLVLPGCTSANDSVSSTSIGSAVTIPGADVVVTAEQAATLIGKTEVDAEAYAQANGWMWRVMRRDGELFVLTMDYRVSRVTVSIDSGVVTEAIVG